MNGVESCHDAEDSASWARYQNDAAERGGEARSMTISWSCVQRTYASEETEDWASAQEPGLDYSLGVFEQRFHDHHSDKLSLAN
jgi:hypothetical protein